MFQITYQKSGSSNWSVHHVFEKFHSIFSDKYESEYVPPIFLSESGGIHSPHIMTITNKNNGKYLIVSYWDRPSDFFYSGIGWNPEKMVSLITSSGIDDDIEHTPFSYVCYTTDFDIYSKENKIDLENKKNNELIFRGYLYGDRLSLSKIGKININSDMIRPHSDYYNDLTNTKICLSLNGAGEICNRDIEILSAGSVLFRPKLKQKFHNELKENFHYVPFDYHPDPNIQSDIILSKYNEIKDNYDLLNEVSKNGYQWFLENGTIDSNVKILNEIINEDVIKKLIN
jgi:hypothetical protein